MVDYSLFFFFKQKTAYEMRISDWSSDVCSSDLRPQEPQSTRPLQHRDERTIRHPSILAPTNPPVESICRRPTTRDLQASKPGRRRGEGRHRVEPGPAPRGGRDNQRAKARSEEHTSELQSLMRPSYAVFCLKHKTTSTYSSTQ